MKESVFKRVLANFRTVFSTNVRKRINDNTRRIAALERMMNGMDQRMTEKHLYLTVLEYYARHEEEALAFSKELDYLHQFGNFDNFPYQRDAQMLEVNYGFDDNTKLPYVVHQGKKLFFPADVSVNDVAWYYSNYVQREKLLGIGDEEAPHQYQSPFICVAEGDTVFDIGAAEGLFALDQVDKASRVVIVESDSKWMAPLYHTFAPYGDRVKVIQKLVSAIDTDSTISLKTLLSEMGEPVFIKMDIEGYELPVITSVANVLKERKGIKIAAASYHRQYDADELKAFFDEIGYTSEFSNGYMLFNLYDTPVPPYFRRGIIRAKK